MTSKQRGSSPPASSREALLALLKARRGQWVSGQFMASQTAMTRAAVWKQIGTLKEEGYGIDAQTRQGYRLRQMPDRLLASEIRDGLRTHTWGQGEILYRDTLASTNQTAKEMAANGAAEGSLVVAEYQDQGRGRLERRWFSPAGAGLCLSLLLRPSLLPSESSRLVLLTAVAVAEALREVADINARIKWPNDLLVGGKKIAGILAELAMEMDAVDYMVIGLGINVNTDADGFPEEIRSTATSVLRETGRPFSRVLLLRRILEAFERWYGCFCELGFAPILAKWKSLTDMVGRPVAVHTAGGSYRGQVAGFDRDGFLILRDGQGKKKRLVSGDAQLLEVIS